MTDERTPDPLAALDERARAAAAGVRTAVADRPVPAFDPDLVRIAVDARPDGPERAVGRRVVPILAAAAAVLVVVAAVVALTGRGDPDSAPADRVAPGDLRPYALGAVPDGLGLASVLRGSDAEAGDLDDLQGPTRVYGPDPSRPTVGTSFVPVSDAEGCDLPDAPDDCVPDEDPVAAATEGLPPIDLGGDRRAWDAAENIGGSAVMVELGDRLGLVFGPASEAEVVRAAAAAVAVDGDVPAIPDDALPDGWSQQGEVPLISAIGGVIQGRTAPAVAGWTLSYLPVGEDFGEYEMVAVSSEAGGPLEVGLPTLLADAVEEVQVRGREGHLARLDLSVPTSSTWWTLRWQERPGEVVEVAVTSSTGRFDREDVLALAEDVAVVPPGEIEGLRDEAGRFGLDAEGSTVVGQGRFSDGAAWTLVSMPVDGSDATQLTLRTDASSSGGASGFSGSASAVGPDGEVAPPPEEVFPGGLTIEGGDAYAWVYGPTRDDVRQVVVQDADGATITTVTPVVGGGISGFVAEVPADTADLGVGPDGGAGLVLVALGADGTELGRLDL